MKNETLLSSLQYKHARNLVNAQWQSACIGNFLEAAFARQPVEAIVYKTLKDTTWTPLLHTPWRILGGERGCLEDSRG